MFPLLLLGAAASGIASIFGGVNQAEEEAKRAEQEAENRELQAEDLIRRAKLNVDAFRAQGQTLMGEQTAGYAAGGVDVGHASPLRRAQATAFAIAHQAHSIENEANIQAGMIRRGADQLKGQAKDIRTAGAINAVGSGILNSFNLASKAGAFDVAPTKEPDQPFEGTPSLLGGTYRSNPGWYA